MRRLTQVEAGYIPPPSRHLWPPDDKGIQCSTCRFYIKQGTEHGACQIVYGLIEARACCNVWTEHGKKPHLTYASGAQVKSVLSES